MVLHIAWSVLGEFLEKSVGKVVSKLKFQQGYLQAVLLIACIPTHHQPPPYFFLAVEKLPVENL